MMQFNNREEAEVAAAKIPNGKIVEKKVRVNGKRGRAKKDEIIETMTVYVVSGTRNTRNVVEKLTNATA